MTFSAMVSKRYSLAKKLKFEKASAWNSACCGTDSCCDQGYTDFVLQIRIWSLSDANGRLIIQRSVYDVHAVLEFPSL